MTDFEILRKIEDKMTSNGYELAEANYQTNSAKFKRGYAIVNVSFEMCSCHGGRLAVWESNHTQSSYRIEHGCYDESLGITDPESELLWEIDNEMIPLVNKFFSKMTYKLCEIGRYAKGKEEVTYFQSEEEAFGRLTEGKFPNDNAHTFSEGTIDYPNPVCHLRIKRVYKDSNYSWDKNKMWFKCERTGDDWKTKDTWEAYIDVFEKR